MIRRVVVSMREAVELDVREQLLCTGLTQSYMRTANYYATTWQWFSRVAPKSGVNVGYGIWCCEQAGDGDASSGPKGKPADAAFLGCGSETGQPYNNDDQESYNTCSTPTLIIVRSLHAQSLAQCRPSTRSQQTDRLFSARRVATLQSPTATRAACGYTRHEHAPAIPYGR